MFHAMAYEEDLGTVVNSDLDAVNDQIFMRRNDHFLFTEPYMMLANAYLAPSALRARTNIPHLNAYNRHHIFPIQRSATVVSDPNIQDLRKAPLDIPLNEELAWEVETDGPAMGTESSKVVMLIGAPHWTKEIPPAIQRITVRATAAAAGTIVAWGADGALTFPDQALRGGVYSLIGCQCFDAGSVAFRFIFPRQKFSQGRQLRPGGLCLEAINNIPWYPLDDGMGEWGRFHTFEPPTVQVFANATAASVQELHLTLLYLGDENVDALLDGTM